MEVASGTCERPSARDDRRDRQRSESNVRRIALSAALMLAVFQYAQTQGQVAAGKLPASGTQKQNQSSAAPADESGPAPEPGTDAELQTGTTLTRKGSFREAIPHLLAARAGASHQYPASFNLALCYVGTGQFRAAIEVLNDLRGQGHDSVDVENLLAQAYIANAQPKEGLASLQKAATLSPQNEKLYTFVADACMDHRDYRLGLKVVDLGLQNLPQSARLHYERAVFLTQLDQFDRAKPDFELAGKLGMGGEVGYLAAAHEKLLAGDIPDAIQTAREGVRKGYENHALLTVLGEALIRSGISPGQPELAEAQTALQKAVAGQPNDPTSQIALGSLYLIAGRLQDAIVCLEMARRLDPDQPSVYANLAKAYERRGDAKQAQDALAALEKLNQEQADRIRSAPGERKLGYASGEVLQGEGASPHP